MFARLLLTGFGKDTSANYQTHSPFVLLFSGHCVEFRRRTQRLGIFCQRFCVLDTRYSQTDGHVSWHARG